MVSLESHVRETGNQKNGERERVVTVLVALGGAGGGLSQNICLLEDVEGAFKLFVNKAQKDNSQLERPWK